MSTQDVQQWNWKELIYRHFTADFDRFKYPNTKFLLIGEVADGSLDTIRERVTERVTIILQCYSEGLRKMTPDGDVAAFWEEVSEDVKTKLEWKREHSFTLPDLDSLITFILFARICTRMRMEELDATEKGIARAADGIFLKHFERWPLPLKRAPRRKTAKELSKPDHEQNTEGSDLAAIQPDQEHLAWGYLAEQLSRS